ncbi:MAG: 5-formyltetrahydrofolate cyclo-ligase, partial [Candidatus Cryptobacteroides sp.]
MCPETATGEAKRALRAKIRALRESFVEYDSSAIVRRIQELDPWKKASTVLLYHPLKGEADLGALFQSPGKRIALPLVEGDSLLLKEYLPGTLVKGYAGIMEPVSTAPDINPSDVDLAIVPGVAFDRNGHRLGRG